MLGNSAEATKLSLAVQGKIGLLFLIITAVLNYQKGS